MSAGSGRRWGWFCLEPEWAERVVAAAGVRPGELVVDLGAGTGALTAPLAAAGARVLAVELQPRRADRLRERFAAEPQVRVLEHDALLMLLPARPFRVVANPPYALSTPILRRLTVAGSRMYAADVVLQRAVVTAVVRQQRLRLGRRYRVEEGVRLPRQAFRPRPGVDSAVLRIRARR